MGTEMRTTLALDDELLETAAAYTGLRGNPRWFARRSRR
jgi:hypothetical protein